MFFLNKLRDLNFEIIEILEKEMNEELYITEICARKENKDYRFIFKTKKNITKADFQDLII